MSENKNLEMRLRDLVLNWRERTPSMHPDADNAYEAACLNQLQSCARELEEIIEPTQPPHSIRSLLPIDVKGTGFDINHELMEFLVDDVVRAYRNKTLDISVHQMATRIIAAFAAYEKEGTPEAFRKTLNREGALHLPMCKTCDNRANGTHGYCKCCQGVHENCSHKKKGAK